ncbi:transglycosylase domain-containing protein [Streptomyces sp. H27-H1]|uniref:transglycosylase domain-containing protein n=1 Tax=Streptomyces sp. H27-H1 TaxID=2996461 RepID=UPI00226FF75A|nr:transglycosylase domain-containing protein [Streptomyces sp. H27-H1]MCY0932486.1 transglycosylase domain-containing protein [Streptomyces sp. H27-H1]
MPRPRTVMWSILGGLLLMLGVFGAGYLLVSVPDPNEKAVAESNVWLYQDGSEIGRSGVARRTSVPLSQVSRAAQEATLAAEDRSFYTDPAISVTGIARALYNNVTGGSRQGGSGLTQQYVKNHYLTQEVSLTRKFKELFIAIKVNQKMSKDEILAGYLNTSYYGRGAYGIQSAARSYFDVDAKNLTAAQGAYLATLLNAPTRYDVKQSPEHRDRAVARWNYVMDGMRSTGTISAADRAKAVFPEPLEPKQSEGMAGQNGYLMQAARAYLLAGGTVSEAELDAGGWKIKTTFDKVKQADLVTAVDKELNDHLDPTSRANDRGVRSGAASVENASGKVVALYGGPDYLKQFINNATRRDVQAGSTFKPFAFAAALEGKAKDTDGLRIGPRSLYNGNNDYTATNGYSPGNQGGKSYGDVSVREAMARSVNTVFAQLAQDAGLRSVRDAAVASGLPESTPGLTAVPSLPLGVATPSALDLAGAYATFANRGVHHDPHLVLELSHGEEKRDLPEGTSDRAFSTATADTVTDVLRSTVDASYGSGKAAKAAGRPAAGKTGTTNEHKSYWFIGYTPELTTSVGVFREDPDSHAQLSLQGLGGEAGGGGGFPARVWAAYTKSALSDMPVQDFRTSASTSGSGSGADTGTGSGSGGRGPAPTGGDERGTDPVPTPSTPPSASDGPPVAPDPSSPPTGPTGPPSPTDPTGPTDPPPGTIPDDDIPPTPPVSAPPDGNGPPVGPSRPRL